MKSSISSSLVHLETRFWLKKLKKLESRLENEELKEEEQKKGGEEKQCPIVDARCLKIN